MYTFYRPVVGIFLLLGITSISHAQEEVDRKQTFPISCALTNHSWAFPLSSMFRINPVYPGLQLGSEYSYKEKTNFKLYQSVELGGFVNRSSGSAVYLNSNLGIRAKFKFGLRTDFAFGLGYFHGFHPTPIYAQMEDGSFARVKDKGIGALSSNFKIGIGYAFPKSNRDLTLFTSYQWLVSTRYWSLITIRPNAMLHLGVKANLFTSSKH